VLRVQEHDTVGEYLGDLMDLVVRASPGPFAVVHRSTGRWEITRAPTGAVVATTSRQADAQLLAAALPAIRGLASALAAVLGQHRDLGGRICAADGQQMPCATRRAIEDELRSRPGRPE